MKSIKMGILADTPVHERTYIELVAQYQANAEHVVGSRRKDNVTHLTTMPGLFKGPDDTFSRGHNK